ncbi:MAG TPA: hypothetical protein VMZ29_13565 [Candidatus Bathyarchaeia archaeon]|nr:hypothetical protein [Candidatus Bathyarchaeia archaeon]
MTINKKTPSFELNPEGLGSIVVYALFIAGFLGVLMYFAFYYQNMVLYISIPFILLLGFSG